MTDVYVVQADGTTTPMPMIHCKNEQRELQDLVLGNLDLIPGHQITPEDPRRWLLIRSEMPVPTPSDSSNSWSVDLLVADQSAIPTFIECKRFSDHRSRREVVGQVLDYAANAVEYWTDSELQRMAEAAAECRGETITDALRTLQADCGDEPELFFQRIVDNLREGVLRILFLLEEAPIELRRIADFLNQQMERSEVLVVEARQYQDAGIRIVVPRVCGYRDEARAMKKRSVVATRGGETWNADRFWADVSERLNETERKSLMAIYALSESPQFGLRWGKGKVTGSFTILVHQLQDAPLLAVYSTGRLAFNFAALRKSALQVQLSAELLRALRQAGLVFPEGAETKYPEFAIESWGTRANDIATGVQRTLSTVTEEGA